jgi:tetratricopeptide (TPR) repeat protein
VQETVRHHGDILDLMQLVIALRRFPALRTKNLVALERMLELQREHGAPNETIADSYADLGTLVYRLGDLDAALVHLQAALDLLQDAEKETIRDKIAYLHEPPCFSKRVTCTVASMPFSRSSHTEVSRRGNGDCCCNDQQPWRAYYYQRSLRKISSSTAATIPVRLDRITT